MNLISDLVVVVHADEKLGVVSVGKQCGYVRADAFKSSKVVVIQLENKAGDNESLLPIRH